MRRTSRATTASSPTRTASRSSSPRRCGRCIKRRHPRIIVSTYQAASGAGAAAMEELRDQARDYAAGGNHAEGLPAPDRLQRLLAQHQGGRNGYNEEENKVMEETRKIFRDAAICRRADLHPRARSARTLRGDQRSNSTSRCRPRRRARSCALRRASAGRRHGAQSLPDAASKPAATYDVHVGRIRRDLSDPNGLRCSWPATSC